MKRVTDKDIPKLKPHVGSWFLIRTETNEVITEVSRDRKRILKGLNADKVSIVAADVHLSNLSEVNQ